MILELELHRINKVRDHYRLDDAVHYELANDPVTGKMSAEEFLDLDPPPSFLKQYSLAGEELYDEKGNFAPNGVRWVRWSLETKTAAVIVVSRRRRPFR